MDILANKEYKTELRSRGAIIKNNLVIAPFEVVARPDYKTGSSVVL